MLDGSESSSPRALFLEIYFDSSRHIFFFKGGWEMGEAMAAARDWDPNQVSGLSMIPHHYLICLALCNYAVLEKQIV